MNHKNALGKANQILDEERLNPTVNYVVNRKEASDISIALAPLELQGLRSQEHFRVQEDSSKWIFESTNYNLLCALLTQAPEDQRTAIVNAALSRIKTPAACARATGISYPNWKEFSSELPLVVEFCVRAGFRQDFFKTLREANPMVGHMMLLRQLREMIALNFTSLTDEEYIELDLTARV